MKPNGAPGKDGITADILKENEAILSPLFSDYFHSLFNLGHFPHHWKTAVACFIPKPNSQTHTAKSFRPISLIDNPSKLLEKAINERLVRYLHEHGKLSLKQYGFTKQKKH